MNEPRVDGSLAMELQAPQVACLPRTTGHRRLRCGCRDPLGTACAELQSKQHSVQGREQVRRNLVCRGWRVGSERTSRAAAGVLASR